VTNPLYKVGIFVQICWTHCNKTNKFQCCQYYALIRILPEEPILKLAVIRASLSHPLPFRRHRNSQHVKGLAIFCGEFAAFPGAVREYGIQEFAFFRWRLTLEQDGRGVRQWNAPR